MNCNGWVNHVAFTPDATTICYISHDCELNFADVSEAGGDKKTKPKTSVKVLHTGNPHLSCTFLDDNTLVATGFDKVPFIYKKEGTDWKVTAMLDDGINKKRPPKITGNNFIDKKVYFN